MSPFPLLVLAALACATEEPKARTAPSEPPPKVLVYTLSAGFEHEVVRRAEPEGPSPVERALIGLGERTGSFEAVCSRDHAEFDRERLARYALVLFYTTGELPLSPERRAALFDFVRSGRGFVGVHCATDTWYEVEEYGELVGARFDGHPWHQRVRVLVERRDHPATRHLGGSFEVEDEIYQFRAFDRAKVQVLLSLDTASVDLARPDVRRVDRDFALAWTREHGRGRVFYTALGHRPEVWGDERFLAHLAGGIAWAMRREPKQPDAAPRAPAPDAPRAPEPRSSALPAEERSYAEHAARAPGDPASGFRLFRDAGRTTCLRCHTVHGVGARVGPELSDVGARLDRAAIAAAILDPARDVDERWRATTFELADGRIVSGQVLRESGEAIDVVDVDGVPRALRPGEVVARRRSTTSIMPQGLARLVTRDEFADLVAYLATLQGAPGG